MYFFANQTDKQVRQNRLANQGGLGVVRSGLASAAVDDLSHQICGDAMTGSVLIGDVQITEGDSGTTTAFFTVVRSGGTDAFSVNFATSNGTATAGSDYTATTGTLSFDVNATSRTISVPIIGDTNVEP